ncbi:hypothetical protein [Cochlodiniinecator piscidefendens]|uniref:hypothetical protein n=1 Tax=Cochlodiniinecator piscidefendens TaxID=2715756 RepID=UPI00140E024F|nr:hypothetical protein [Cochlodiniinecator piscidefendens]
MRGFVVAAAMFAGVSAQAQEWQLLDEAGIREALTDQTVVYGSATQIFYASGRTLYNAGTDSWGSWRVTGDRYCSQWPPNTLWACFDLERSGDQVRFTGDYDDVSTGDIVASEIN